MFIAPIIALALSLQPGTSVGSPVFDNEWIAAWVTARPLGMKRDLPKILYCVIPTSVVIDGTSRSCGKDEAIFIREGDVALQRTAPDTTALIAELKQPPKGSFTMRPDDATRLAPEIYHLILENDFVRVIKVTVTPGHRSEMHHHEGRDFRYTLTPVHARSTSPTGVAGEANLQPHYAFWTANAGEHIFENVGSSDAVAIMLELK